MNKLGRFNSVGFTGWKGLTSSNHLGAIFREAPQKASELMIQLMAYDRGHSLESFLSKFPTKEFENEKEYHWDVITSARRNIPLLEARDEDGTVVVAGRATNVGVHTAPFYLVFPEDWFFDGEVIVGHLNQVYPMRILGDPKLEGTNAVYRVELMGGNTEGIPAERLLAGERFSVDYAPVEQALSREVGGIRHSTPVSMRNEFSKIRIKHKVEGTTMLNKKIAIGIPIIKNNGSGKMVQTTTNMWMHYEDYEVENTFSMYKHNLLAFGTSNRNAGGEYLNIGKSGRVIQMGSGIFEQMESGNTIYYNSFDVDFPLAIIEDALFELCESTSNNFNKKFVLRTGNRGAVQFHKAILREASGWMAAIVDGSPSAIQSVKSALHSNAMSAGFQFVEYKAPNGITLCVEVDEMYDDPIRNKIRHPKGGVAMSYRYDILDLGTGDSPNIYKCSIKGQPEVRGYQWGFVNPFTGQINNNHMSYDEDSAVIHKMASLGALVLDPTRTISIIPNILQG